MALHRPATIELFHIAFLDALATKVKPDRYVLKGGASLRYFWKSVRYSEDLDLDVVLGQSWRLQEQVDAVLSSPQLKLLLRAGDLEVAEVSKPKQTETTQRWKVGLRAAGFSDLVRTKIEFSRRDEEPRYRLDVLPREIVRPYGLRPPSVQRYTGDAPIEQKIVALARRAQVQARDVFDLDLLFRARPERTRLLDSRLLTKAVDQAAGVSYAEYRDQVVPFLEPDARILYESEGAWDQMQTFVIEQLEESR